MNNIVDFLTQAGEKWEQLFVFPLSVLKNLPYVACFLNIYAENLQINWVWFDILTDLLVNPKYRLKIMEMWEIIY